MMTANRPAAATPDEARPSAELFKTSLLAWYARQKAGGPASTRAARVAVPAARRGRRGGRRASV
jgi:hypothetical protein